MKLKQAYHSHPHFLTLNCIYIAKVISNVDVDSWRSHVGAGGRSQLTIRESCPGKYFCAFVINLLTAWKNITEKNEYLMLPWDKTSRKQAKASPIKCLDQDEKFDGPCRRLEAFIFMFMSSSRWKHRVLLQTGGARWIFDLSYRTKILIGI